MLETVSLFVLAFILLWVGSGMAVSAVTRISYMLRSSSFFVSFFVLGLFTSITEIMVGINSVLEKTPQIYVGNLIGSSVVVFIMVIPLVAVIGNGVKLNHNFDLKNLVSATVVVGFPALLTLDNRFSFVDALVCITIYGYFLFMLGTNTGIVNKFLHVRMSAKAFVINFFKITAAVILVFTGSRILVDNTPALAEYLGISPFLIGILLISIGTNVPELSIAIRSILANKKDIAFGNYVGSATLNTLEMGVLSLFADTPVYAGGSNLSIVVFAVGLYLFVKFVKSKKEISRKEGIVLLICYLIFVFFEMAAGPGWDIFG